MIKIFDKNNPVDVWYKNLTKSDRWFATNHVYNFICDRIGSDKFKAVLHSHHEWTAVRSYCKWLLENN